MYAHQLCLPPWSTCPPLQFLRTLCTNWKLLLVDYSAEIAGPHHPLPSAFAPPLISTNHSALHASYLKVKLFNFHAQVEHFVLLGTNDPFAVVDVILSSGEPKIVGWITFLQVLWFAASIFGFLWSRIQVYVLLSPGWFRHLQAFCQTRIPLIRFDGVSLFIGWGGWFASVTCYFHPQLRLSCIASLQSFFGETRFRPRTSPDCSLAGKFHLQSPIWTEQ